MSNKLKETLLEYAESSTPVFLQEGDYLIHQNTQADAAFVVVSGKLHVIINEVTGEQKIVAEIGAGETVGEMSMVTGRRRSTSVRAARDTELRRIEKSEFDRILLSHPQVLLDLTRLIAMRLDQTTRLRELHFKPKNIAVIPAGHDFDTFKIYARRFAEALSSRGPTQYLDFEYLLAAKLTNNQDDLLEKLDEDAEFIRIFNAIEDKNDFIVNVANCTMDAWTRHCLRTADRIYIVASNGSLSSLNDIERQLFGGDVLKGAHHIELLLAHPADAKIGKGNMKWRLGRQASRYGNISIDSKEDYEKQIRFLLGETVGLVLGGGGARGLAHIGVIKAMLELKIPIDIIGGSSVGALIAGAHCLGLTPEEQISVLDRYSKMHRPYKRYTLPFISILSSKHLDRFYKDVYGDALIEESKTDFFAVSCNLSAAQKLVHVRGLFHKAVRASTSLPGVFPPAVENNDLLIDGGVMDNLPIQEMRSRGAGKIIAVSLAPTEDLAFSTYLGQLPRSMDIVKNSFLRAANRLKYPGIMEILVKTLMLNSTKYRVDAERGANLILRPPVEKVKLLDFSQMSEVMQIGYNFAKPILAEFKESTS